MYHYEGGRIMEWIEADPIPKALFVNTPKSATGSAVMFSLIQTKSWIRIDA